MAKIKKIPNVVSKESSTSNDVGRKTLGKFQLFLTSCFSAFLCASIFCTPEGAVREGDYLPIALLFLLLVIGTSLGTLRLISHFSSSIKDATEVGAVDAVSVSHSAKRFVVLIADWSLFAFFLLCTISCLRVAFLHSGDVRFALNGYWSFITPVLLYFFLRFFSALFSERLVLEIFIVLCSCVLAECVFSTYSYAVINPRIREAYRENPDKILAENGMNFEKNSRERLLFEKRLLESVEPTGTYGLTNTLAGVLTPVTILALVGIPWLRLFSRGRPVEGKKKLFCWIQILLILSSLLLAFFVLLITKSRSACIALACGLGIWFVLWLFSLVRKDGPSARIGAQFAIGTGIFLIIAVAVAILTGAVDREIITEAGKSLSYRLDYWIATMRMIADHPLLGIGPGEFQSLYARYILPTASEFIADPHNFAFELCALFGIPALGAFGVFILTTLISAILVAFDLMFVRKSVNSSLHASIKKESAFEPDPGTLHAAMFIGLTLGLGITFFCSFFQSAPVDLNFYGVAFVSFCLSTLATTGLNLVFETSQFVVKSTVAIFIAIIALLINLCAAGGIGYAPVSTILFIFAAIVVNRAQYKRIVPVCEADGDVVPFKLRARSYRYAVITVLLISLSLTAIFYATSYKPRMNAFLFELRYESNPQAGIKELLSDGALEKIDPKSVVVVSQYYYAVGQVYAQNATQENQRRWQAAYDKIERVSPNSPAIRERCGEFDQRQFERNKDRSEFLDSAIRFYEEAVDLSPTDVGKKEKLFAMLKTAKRFDEAKDVAEQALEFDERTSHEDRKLTDGIRREMRAFVEENH